MAAVSDGFSTAARTRRTALSSRERGAFLLEALVALLIFAFGALAVTGLHERAVRHVNDAQFRAEAVQLAHAAIGHMRASASPALFANFDSRAAGTGYAWIVDQAKRLPGVDDGINLPSVTISDGPATGSRNVAVTIFWRHPGETSVHRHDAVAVVYGT